MKRIIFLLAFFVIALVPGIAADITASGACSNFALKKSNVQDAAALQYGFNFSLSDKIEKQLTGTIRCDADPLNGNLVSARVSYGTSFFDISAGPSFGILNAVDSDDIVSTLVQPGIGLGIHIIGWGKFLSTIDTDFALPPYSDNSGQVYLQRGELSTVFYLPNVLCTLGVTQKMNTESGSHMISITDYGMYNEAYLKGSPFRVAVNFIYRVTSYYITAESTDNTKVGNILLGGGITWARRNDFSLFIKGDASLYSFSYGDDLSGLDKLFFDITAGVTWHTSSGNTQE